MADELPGGNFNVLQPSRTGGQAGIEHAVAQRVESLREIQQVAGARMHRDGGLQRCAVDSCEVAFRPMRMQALTDLCQRREGGFDCSFGGGCRGAGRLHGDECAQ
jgi:hypothetical protein